MVHKMSSTPPFPSKLLVRMPNWLGDCVIASPILSGLKKLFPHARLDILIKENISGLGSVLSSVDKTIIMPSRGASSTIDDTLDEIRKSDYDTVLILANSFRAAWQMWKAGVPERAGYAGEFRSPLLTRAIKRPPKHSLSQFEYYAKLAGEVFPEFEPVQEGLRIPGKFLKRADGLLPLRDKPLVGMGFGASYGAAKMWPAERFAKLADKLSNSAYVILFGAGADQEVEKIVINASRSKLVSLVGKTDIPTLAAALSRLDLYITNDTGPMHLAAAAGAPTLAVFGPTSPDETSPRGANVKVIYRKADCAPCWRRSCPTDHRCMTSINVDDVYEEAIKMLEAGPGV